MTNTWTEEAPLLVGKSEPSVGLVATTIVAADGYNAASGDNGDNEGYSVSTNSWKSLAADPTGRNAACTGSTGGQLYVASGSNSGGSPQSVTESFRLSKNKWTTLASIPQAVIAPGSAVNKGVLYCFGGGDNGIPNEGNVYSIPAANQGNSALVFTIVSQILMLSKTVNLIPASTAVEVR